MTKAKTPAGAPVSGSFSCLYQEALWSTRGSSDKLYVVQLEEFKPASGGAAEYSAVAYYGRRGATLKRVAKGDPSPYKTEAEARISKLAREKRGEGYADWTGVIPGMPSGAPVPGAGTVLAGGSGASSVTPATSGPAVMLASDLRRGDEDAHLEELLCDPNWIAQKKYDGERCTIRMTREGLQAFNRTGGPRALSSAAADSLMKLASLHHFGSGRRTTFDGEIMGDVYIAYDLMEIRNDDVRDLDFEERYGQLEVLLTTEPHILAPCAWNEGEKRAMLAQAMTEQWEGLVFRKLNAGYFSGRSPAIVRHKLWESVTARVLTQSPTKRSVRIGLLASSGSPDEVECGNVTIPANADIPAIDSLIEVRYLYAHEGGSLYQPVFKEPRWDKEAPDCIEGLRRPPAERRAPALS